MPMVTSNLLEMNAPQKNTAAGTRVQMQRLDHREKTLPFKSLVKKKAKLLLQKDKRTEQKTEIQT